MFRNKTMIYDHMLCIQADMCFSLEKPLFQNEYWQKAKHILDFGTGNGYYISLLASKFPNKNFIAVEHEPKMFAIAQKRTKLKNLEMLSGSYDSLPENLKFDFVILRLVTSHLSERDSIFLQLRKHISSRGTILIIDANDDLLVIKPELPNFRRVLKELRKNIHDEGGQRNLKDVVPKELSDLGFALEYSHDYIVNTFKSATNSVEKMYLYMYLTAELHLGSPLPIKLSNELFSWVISENTYVQYGLFASLFVRGT